MHDTTGKEMLNQYEGETSPQAEEASSDSSDEISSESSEETLLSETEERISEEIRREIEMRLLYYSQAGKEAIEERLEDLDKEWDLGRAFEANAAGMALFGLTFGTLFGRKWFLLPLLAAGCLLQKSVKGWSPPMMLLRRLGIRKQTEIDYERYALKALRGDFQEIKPAEAGIHELGRVLEAVEKK